MPSKYSRTKAGHLSSICRVNSVSWKEWADSNSSVFVIQVSEMCELLNILMTDVEWPRWRRFFLRFFERLRSLTIFAPSVEVEIFGAKRLERRASGRLPRRSPFLIRRVRFKTIKNARRTGKPRIEPRMLAEIATITDDPASDASRRSVQNGGNKTASLFSKEGMKGENQDAMLVLEDFADQPGTVFCGVFDGHGPDGHLIARRVRDLLPGKLASCWRIAYDIHPPGTGLLHQGNRSFTANAGGDPKLIMAWKESLISAHKQVDRDLALYYDELDPTFSGTTAVTLVKQGSDLYIGNVGDSRAILGFLTDENSMMALQLTVDLKPNLRKEAERITKLKGRVFSLPHEPSVKRVWLPGIDSPGLAMARSLGDHCLKKFGVISEPTVTYRKLSVRDKFIVLASDGVWDVLTNDEVVEIVASSHRSLAAEAVVEAATSTWNKKRPQSRADDCTAICLFLDDHLASSSSSSTFRVVNEDSGLKKTATSLISLHRMFTAKLKMDKSASCSELELLTVSTSESTEIVSANAGALNKNLSRGKRAGLLFIGDD